MSKFKFECYDEDDLNSKITIEFEAEVWLDAFPKFINLCKAAGFYINDGTALYAPTASPELFGDRDFLLFDDDLTENETGDNSTIVKDDNHSESYYDPTHNC